MVAPNTVSVFCPASMPRSIDCYRTLDMAHTQEVLESCSGEATRSSASLLPQKHSCRNCCVCVCVSPTSFSGTMGFLWFLHGFLIWFMLRISCATASVPLERPFGGGPLLRPRALGGSGGTARRSWPRTRPIATRSGRRRRRSLRLGTRGFGVTGPRSAEFNGPIGTLSFSDPLGWELASLKHASRCARVDESNKKKNNNKNNNNNNHNNNRNHRSH